MAIKTKKKNLLEKGIPFIAILFIIASFINCTTPKKNKKPPQISWINFDWVGDSLSNRYFDKLAITIPFSLEGVPHKFNSQFDLGATSTMVYGNSINPYINAYPDLFKKLDTVNRTSLLQGKKVGAFKNINFKLDTVLFKSKRVLYFDEFGDVLTKDSIHTKTVKHIGTIGASLFQDKYLIIDFPNHRIAVLDSLTQPYKEKTTFVAAKLDKGRIKVPVSINGSTHYFMFDTGSSIFPLSVAKKDIQQISNTHIATDTLNVSSWGEYYDIHGYPINSIVSVGDIQLETQNLNVYDSKEDFEQFYIEEEIMGIMGNTFFLDKEIIIDFKNKRFGIVANDNN